MSDEGEGHKSKSNLHTEPVKKADHYRQPDKNQKRSHVLECYEGSSPRRITAQESAGAPGREVPIRGGPFVKGDIMRSSRGTPRKGGEGRQDRENL